MKFTKPKLNGLFFWCKTETTKAEEMIQLYLKYIPQLRKIMNEPQQDETSDGEKIGMMYDFYKNYGNTTSGFGDGGFISNIMVGSDGDVVENGTPTNPTDNSKNESQDKRIAATPLSVLNELETIPTPFSLENLDEKIATLKDKSKLINQRYAKAQIEGLCKRLENRKKYKDEIDFYKKFPNTKDEKIDALLGKYKLVMKESDLFVPTFPKEAIDTMKEYTRVTEKISGEKPVFYVIAEEKDFQKKAEKLDPILLVQSPFGFFWQVLGAWDKEMLLLTEL